MDPQQVTKLKQLQIRIAAIAIRCMQDDREETRDRLREAVNAIDSILPPTNPTKDE